MLPVAVNTLSTRDVLVGEVSYPYNNQSIKTGVFCCCLIINGTFTVAWQQIWCCLWMMTGAFLNAPHSSLLNQKLGCCLDVCCMFLVQNIYTILAWRQWRIHLILKNVVSFNYVGLIEMYSVVPWNHLQTYLGKFNKFGILCGKMP